MGKFDIDDILNDLGVSGEGDGNGKRNRKQLPRPDQPGPIDEGGPARKLDPFAPPGSPRGPVNRHTIDKAEQAFSPLPAMPSGQRGFGLRDDAPTSADDPAVPIKPPEAPRATVGEALSNIYDPASEGHGELAHAPAELAAFLVNQGSITPAQATAAQQVVATSSGQNIADLLVEQGADEIKVYQGVAELADVPFERVDIDRGLDGGFDGTMLQRLTSDFCRNHLILPLRVVKSAPGVPGRVVVGATRPDDVFLLDEVRRRLGTASVKLVVVPPSDVKMAIELVGQQAVAEQQQQENLSEILSDVDEADVQVEKIRESQEVDLEAQAAESPVIRYVNYIIQTAVKEGASDIHIEPAEKKLKVRFRIDGVLFEMMHPPAGMSAAITSRLKIMGNLDISERRLPQDGRIRCVVGGRKLDLRMSTLPNTYGEKTVMRILDTKSINVELENLGFDPDTLSVWQKAIDEPHGIVLVTGPTGSGKTTTLYASLRQLDKNSMNISTVEDPVEYHLDGVTQTQMHDKIGMTFAKALKALLRQDPDVIMLGEIRDKETAETAVQAALTGHLVLSTLHTNDAPSSITRLVNIGLEPFLVGAAVRAVLAQRLVRRLCANCKVQEKPSEEFAEYLTMVGLSADTVWAGKGCNKCRNRGYTGRVGIYELLTVDDQLRDMIARNPNVAEFRRICIERGMVTLRADGMHKVAQGLTSVEEVIRATEANG
ncbi:MAG: Flp pilus assembly complex ATPase component TadA [Phycisphaerales bacterium]|nr:Flp pilus assembly complex ATPase component TadA [Phycisphaerales bacterium]